MLKKLTIFILVFSMSVMMFACGAGVKNGFVKQNGQTYYYVDDVMKTGWQQINGNWYYFYESEYVDGEHKVIGAMKYNTWLKEGNDWYFFKDDGKMLANSWLNDEENSKKYYFDGNGKMLVNCQYEIDNKKYIFDADGNPMDEEEYEIQLKQTFLTKYKSIYAAEYANYEYEIDKLVRKGDFVAAKLKLDSYDKLVDKYDYKAIVDTPSHRNQLTSEKERNLDAIFSDDNKARLFIKQYKNLIK